MEGETMTRDDTSLALADIRAERMRQMHSEGWTPEHDDRHERGEMAAASGCYAIVASCSDRSRQQFQAQQHPYPEWPWDNKWWKPKDRRHDLVRAGALIVAEIERLDRASRANAVLQDMVVAETLDT